MNRLYEFLGALLWTFYSVSLVSYKAAINFWDRYYRGIVLEVKYLTIKWVSLIAELIFSDWAVGVCFNYIIFYKLNKKCFQFLHFLNKLEFFLKNPRWRSSSWMMSQTQAASQTTVGYKFACTSQGLMNFSLLGYSFLCQNDSPFFWCFTFRRYIPVESFSS